MFLFAAVCVIALLMIMLFYIMSKYMSLSQEIKQQEERHIEESYIRDRHYTEMKEQYRKYRELRHDFEAHITMLNALQEKGNQNEVKNYIQTLRSQYKVLKKITFCNNPVIDALIFSINETATQLSIRTDFKFVPPQSISIPNFELCSLLSNMLQNALTGASNYDGEDKWMELETFNKSGFYVIVVKNSSNPVTDDLETTKPDKANHGIGIDIIKNIARKYRGNAVLKYKSGEFTCIVNLEI